MKVKVRTASLVAGISLMLAGSASADSLAGSASAEAVEGTTTSAAILGSDGMETGGMEVSGAQTEAAEEAGGSLFDYNSGVMKTLSNDGEGYSLAGIEGINVGGWLSFGYTSRSTGMFNDQPDQINLHQTWLYAEKVADGSEGLDWGFRFDAMYGTDAGDTQAFGNNPGKWDFDNGFDRGGGYGFALPQAYVELAYEDFSVIGGHFYTLLGYEVVPSPDNFFFSHAFTMYNSEAFTHTGVLGSYSGIEGLEIYAGWTAGWDTGFDQYDGGSNFLGGFSYTPIDQVSVTYIATAGNLGAIGKGYTHSIVVDTMPIDDIGLNYVFQSDYVDVTDFSTIGINQYLMYFPWDEIGFGIRGEWWNIFAKDTGGENTSYYQTTIGTHLKPLPNVIIRPELRWQWSSNAGKNPAYGVAGLPVYGDGVIFGMDVVLTF